MRHRDNGISYRRGVLTPEVLSPAGLDRHWNRVVPVSSPGQSRDRPVARGRVLEVVKEEILENGTRGAEWQVDTAARRLGHLDGVHGRGDLSAVSRSDRCRSDQVQVRVLHGMVVIDKVRRREEVGRQRPVLDLAGLDEAYARDREPVVSAAIHHEGVGMVGYTAIGVDSSVLVKGARIQEVTYPG